MATTKVVTALWHDNTLVAAAGDETSDTATLDDGYGAALHVIITNGATGPTVAAKCQVQVSADNSHWFNFGPALQSLTGNSVVSQWGGIDIPIGVEYLRLVAGSNTAQDVTISADISEVTAV